MHRELSRSQSFYAQQQPTHSSNHGQIIPPRDPFQGYDMPTPYQYVSRGSNYCRFRIDLRHYDQGIVTGMLNLNNFEAPGQ